MESVPTNPKIYHITPLDNLRQIVQSDGLWSDAKCDAQNLNYTNVGMSAIKKRRLEEQFVSCHPDTKVGEYVPFYFCARSVMLYILHRGNHPDTTYRGGQGPIIHLMADLQDVVGWAEANAVKWAFSDCNAGAGYAQFYSDYSSLDKVRWNAVRARDWRNPEIKEGKQAEFLIHESFPWKLIVQIGVKDVSTKVKVDDILLDADHQPLVNVERSWYY